MKEKILIHKKALVESKYIDKGTRIWEFCHVLPGTVIGKECNICAYTFIENDVVIGNNVTVKNGVSIWNRMRIEDDVFIGPNAVFTNDIHPRAEFKRGATELIETILKVGCTIGANATLLCGLVVGIYSFIGAGAVFTKDVPDYALIIGYPAIQIGYTCRCGNRMIPKVKCSCGRVYVKRDKIVKLIHNF